jgi:hypothetical protein
VYNEEQPDDVLDRFMKLLIPVTNKDAPNQENDCKTVKSPSIDEKLKKGIVERDEAKGM